MKIPASRRAAVRQFERFDEITALVWLYAMLNQIAALFPGNTEDFPVQAILNCYQHLNPAAQQKMRDQIMVLLWNWKQSTDDTWGKSASRALLSLIEELPVPDAKSVLQDLVESNRFSQMPSLQPAVLRAIVPLSTADDIDFWQKTRARFGDYTRIVDQALKKIMP